VTALRKLLKRLPGETHDAWFTRIAEELLGRYRLIANGHSLRLRHIEFYHKSVEHPDPFVHGFEIQKTPCLWYFHRVGSGYRGGTYKGMDLTFGDGELPGGILFRAAETEDGQRIQGPSNLVDYLLKVTKVKSVADLDARIGHADDPKSILFLQRQRRSDSISLIRKARVGLSMKRATPTSQHANYVNRLYLFSSL
jgi:hypothetical protein